MSRLLQRCCSTVKRLSSSSVRATCQAAEMSCSALLFKSPAFRSLVRCQVPYRRSYSSSTPFDEAAGLDTEEAAEKEAERRLKPLLSGLERESVFICTGQYYSHPFNNKYFVLSAEQPSAALAFEARSSVNERLAFPLSNEHGRQALTAVVEKAKLRGGPLEVYQGEVDALDTTAWHRGHTFEPAYTLFTRENGPTCFINDHKQEIRVNWLDDYRVISTASVTAVGIRLSEEPWIQRQLFILTKDGEQDEVTLLEYEETRDGGITALASEHDLANLMVSSEWLTKAAGHLALRLTKLAGRRIPLLLPSELREDGNVWVQMRNQMWLSEAISSPAHKAESKPEEESVADFARKIVHW